MTDITGGTTSFGFPELTGKEIDFFFRSVFIKKATLCTDMACHGKCECLVARTWFCLLPPQVCDPCSLHVLAV